MRHLRQAAAFVAAVLVLTVGVSLAWMGAWVTFRSTAEVAVFPLPSFLIAVCIATVFWLRTRRRIRTRQGFLRLLLCSVLGVYAALCGLHFTQKSPTRFAFLGEHPKAFPIEPAWPGLVGAAYTFAGQADLVMTHAEAELSGLGYRIERTEGGLSATPPTGEPIDGICVDVYPGKAIGKRFVVDGDMVTLEKRTDWVTVEIVEPDFLPWWLRMEIP